MLMYLIEKVDTVICDILESNTILDHITRLSMDDEGYALAFINDKQKKASKKVDRKVARELAR